MMRQSKGPKMPWQAWFGLSAVGVFVSLMTFVHSGDVLLLCKRGQEAKAKPVCRVTSTSLGCVLSDDQFDDIVSAEVKNSGGKHPNLFIELQRKSEPALLEGTILGTGFGREEAVNRELSEMAGRINGFLTDSTAPELRIQVAEDSSGAVMFCGVVLVLAVVMVILGFRSKRRWREFLASRHDSAADEDSSAGVT
jgi:hypothetical protein